MRKLTRILVEILASIAGFSAGVPFGFKWTPPVTTPQCSEERNLLRPWQ